MRTADAAVVPAAGAEGAAPRARRLSAEAAALWQKFPPRAVAASWPATQAGRRAVVSQAMTCPYAAAENDQSREKRLACRSASTGATTSSKRE